MLIAKKPLDDDDQKVNFPKMGAKKVVKVPNKAVKKVVKKVKGKKAKSAKWAAKAAEALAQKA